MLSYKLIESSESSLFIVTSKKDNLYGLEFYSKDIEVHDFDDDFLQENILELAIAKFTKNEATCIKSVVDDCYSIFREVINGKFSNKIIYLSMDQDSARSHLIENLIIKNKLKNGDENIVHLRVSGIAQKSFYFIFNEHKISSIEVINALVAYFKKEYDINLTFN